MDYLVKVRKNDLLKLCDELEISINSDPKKKIQAKKIAF